MHCENNLISISGSIPHLRLGVSCKERIYHLLSPKGGAKSVRRAKNSGTGRRLAPKTLRGRARARVFDGAAAARSSSRFFAMRRQLCALRNGDLFRFEFFSSHLAGLRPAGMHCENSGSSDGSGASARSDRAKSEVFRDRSASAGVVARYFSPCLIFWCFWIKPKAQKKKIHDRRNRFFGKNSDAKIGCVVSAGRRLRDTPTVAGLRRRRLQPARRKGPQYFKPDCGVSQGRNLACMARCSVNSRKVRSSRRFPPVPLRSDRHAPPDIPKGNRHTERSTRPPINNGNRFL